MNERLKRRIHEVREYIRKMTFENQKIEEGIITSNYMEREEEIYRKRDYYHTHQPVEAQIKRTTWTNYDSMINKLHQKQEEAWKRVRRQEEEIEIRNR